MTATVGRGADITLNVQFYAYAGGPAADPDPLTLTIYDPNGSAVSTLTYGTDAGLLRSGTGAYTYDYTVATDATIGQYRAYWAGTINGASTAGSEYFDVVAAGDVDPGVDALIVSAEQVETITGNAVSATTLRQAQNLLEVYAKRLFATDTLSTRDLRYVQQAVAYQAVWVEAHPEVFVQGDYTSVSQADLSVTPRDSKSPWLAPLARAALKRCSWMGARSILVKSHFTSNTEDPLLTDSDRDQWRRM